MEMGSRRARDCPGTGAAAPHCCPWGKTELPPAAVHPQHNCALMPFCWEIPLCIDSMLPQIAMGFHAVGLVQGLLLSLDFLAWEEERDSRK